MLESVAEADLVRKAGQGDEASFRLLYESHRTPVFRFALRMLGSVAQAEDVTQECFMSLLRKPELYQAERASLRTYLCGAARHLALRQLRRQGVETTVDDLPDDPPGPGTEGEPLQRLLDGEAAEAVRHAVQALPPLQREALILFEYEDMSLAEVAAVTDTDVGAVKSRLHRARERLRRSLAPWLAATTADPCKERRP
jgi:RNA polymerase sigma-70 factor (ECF subfamily)